MDQDWKVIKFEDASTYQNTKTKQFANRVFEYAGEIHDGFGPVRLFNGYWTFFNPETMEISEERFVWAHEIYNGFAFVELKDGQSTYFSAQTGKCLRYRSNNALPYSVDWEEVLTKSPFDFDTLPTEYFKEENKEKLTHLLDCIAKSLEDSMTDSSDSKKLTLYSGHVDAVKDIIEKKTAQEKENVEHSTKNAKKISEEEKIQKLKEKIFNSIGSIKLNKFDAGKEK